jgi:hypothetical protein
METRYNDSQITMMQSHVAKWAVTGLLDGLTTEVQRYEMAQLLQNCSNNIKFYKCMIEEMEHDLICLTRRVFASFVDTPSFAVMPTPASFLYGVPIVSRTRTSRHDILYPDISDDEIEDHCDMLSTLTESLVLDLHGFCGDNPNRILVMYTLNIGDEYVKGFHAVQYAGIRRPILIRFSLAERPS